MKKYTIALLLVVAFSSNIFALSPHERIIGRKKAAAPTPDFYAHWNDVAADDERCSSTPCPDTWDSLTDTGGKASVDTVNDVFQIVSNSTTESYLSEDGDVAAAPETTITFTISFSTVDPHNANAYGDIFQVYSDEGYLGRFMLFHAEAVEKLRLARKAYLYDDSVDTETDGDNLDLTVDTFYEAYVYAKKGTDGNSDGYIECGLKDNTAAYIKVGTGAVENYERWNDHGNADAIKCGLRALEWSDNSITVKYNDVKYYIGDYRP